MPQQQNKNIGPIIGTFIVVIVLIVIALYLLVTHINKQKQNVPLDTFSTTTISSRNETDSIKILRNDLNNAIK